MKSTTLLKMAKTLRMSAQALDDHGVFNHETNEATFDIRSVAKELYDEGMKLRKEELNCKYGDKYSDYKDEMSPAHTIRRIFGVNYKDLAEAACKLYELRDKRGSEYIFAYTESRSDTGHVVSGATPEFQLNIAIGIIEYFKEKGYVEIIEQALEDIVNDESSE